MLADRQLTRATLMSPEKDEIRVCIYIYIYIYITFCKDPRATVGLTIAENMAVNLFDSMLCARWIA